MIEIRWGWVRWKPWLFFGRGLRVRARARARKWESLWVGPELLPPVRAWPD